MTAMITETRYVTIKGSLIEGATIAIWLAENCPKAASKLNPHDGGAYQIMQVPFDDEAEYAKFKLFHSDEFNEPARRRAEYEATNRVGGYAFPQGGRAKLIINGGHFAGYSLVRFHTCRHTTLTKAMKKYPLALVSKLAGHASVQITASRYGHVNADDLVEMVGDIAA